MKTISLPYTCTREERIFIKDEIRKSSNMVRLAYNRFQEGKTEKDIRLLSKQLKNIPSDSWFIQCAIKKLITCLKQVKEKLFLVASSISSND